MERPSWDDVWMKTALAVAGRSLCSRAKVGSVIVGIDNRVASVSFNGAPDSFPCHGRPCTEWCDRAQSGATDPTYVTCEAIHAEVNAIARAEWTQIQGGTIYTSSATCINCARVILASGIKRVVHVVHDEDAHRSPVEVTRYLTEGGVAVHEWSPC